MTDDPIRDFLREDARRHSERINYPTCAECGEPVIQDMAVCINGEWYCDECLKENRRTVNYGDFI